MAISPSKYKLKGPQNGVDLDMPEEGKQEVLKSPQGEASQDNVIQKLQSGDYIGAKKLLDELLSFVGTEEESDIIKGIITQIEDYLHSLPAEKQQEIKTIVMGDTIQGGQTNPKYVMEKMNKLSNYSEFIGQINEQTTTTDIKTLPFEKVLSMFETLVNSLATKTKTPADEQQLNDLRAELTGRRDKSKP